MLLRIVISLFLFVIGFLFVWKTRKITLITGEFGWTNRYFGAGGTYTFYRVFGVFLILVSFALLFGFLNFMLP